MASQLSLQRAAQAWCKPETQHIDMDSTLAIAFAEILDEERKQLLTDIQSKFRREVIPSGSKVYSKDLVEFIRRLGASNYIITKDDWNRLSPSEE